MKLLGFSWYLVLIMGEDNNTNGGNPRQGGDFQRGLVFFLGKMGDEYAKR